jgi:hypothetical protein
VAPRNAQPAPAQDSQSTLPLAASGATHPLDSVAATISQIRAELREIAGMLALPVADAPRRRARISTLPAPADSLFPS